MVAGHPRAGDALAAHRLVDLVYRSAADGGRPQPPGEIGGNSSRSGVA